MVIVLLLDVIEVPFKPTRSPMIILDDGENVLNFDGCASAAALHLRESLIIVTLFPRIT